MKETKKTTAKGVAKAESAKAKVESAVKNAAEKAAPIAKAAEKKVASATKAAVKKTTAKMNAKTEVTIQFGGKSYGTEDLVKIAKDVWKYDLNREENEFQSVELFVKPEESKVYYVINGDVNGSFAI